MSIEKEDSWLEGVKDIDATTSGSGLMNVDQEGVDEIKAHAERESKKVKRPVGELVVEFIQIRDELKEERRKFKDLEYDLKNKLEVIETSILDAQRELGLTSISTGEYTAFQTSKTSVRMDDWDTFVNWVMDTGNVHCLEKRPAKLACLEVLEDFNRENIANPDGEHKDLSTIGLLKADEIVVQVRRK